MIPCSAASLSLRLAAARQLPHQREPREITYEQALLVRGAAAAGGSGVVILCSAASLSLRLAAARQLPHQREPRETTYKQAPLVRGAAAAGGSGVVIPCSAASLSLRLADARQLPRQREPREITYEQALLVRESQEKPYIGKPASERFLLCRGNLFFSRLPKLPLRAFGIEKNPIKQREFLTKTACFFKLTAV